MKYFEFLDEFAKVAHEFEVVTDGQIRIAYPEAWECPITRVCRAVKNRSFNIDLVEQAARELDLDECLAQEIVDSSDWYGDARSARTRRDLTELIDKMKQIRMKK